MARKKKGWVSPDPAKKRRKAKAKAHKSPKPLPPKQPLKTTRELQTEAKELSLLATGRAEKVYEPTHFAPEPMPGVVLSGTRRQGRTTFESKKPEGQASEERKQRKTTALKIAQRKRRNSVRYKHKRSEARKAGTYDPTSVGKPGAFKRKTNTPEMLNWRAEEVPAKKCPVRIRIGRRGTVIVIPVLRKSVKDQAIKAVTFTRAEAYRVGKNARLNKRFWGGHTKEEFDEPTGKYTAQLVVKKEKRLVGYRRKIVEEIYKEINGKQRLVGRKYEIVGEIWKDVVVEERVENFRPKTQRKVRIIRDGVTDYRKTTAVQVVRVNPERINLREERKAASRVGKPLRGKKAKAQREKAAKLTSKAAA